MALVSVKLRQMSNKMLLALAMGLSLFISLTAGAVVPLNGKISTGIPIELQDQACGMAFKQEDALSGIRIHANWILSVGHSQSEADDFRVRCGVKKNTDTKGREFIRIDNFAFNQNPKNMQEWSVNDWGLARISGDEKPIPTFPILDSTEQIQNLLLAGRCHVAGASSENVSGIESLKPNFVHLDLVQDVRATTTHLLIEYPGAPIIFKGDSGGVLLCEGETGFALAGLLQYGGKAYPKNGESTNVIGVLLFQPKVMQRIGKVTGVNLFTGETTKYGP